MSPNCIMEVPLQVERYKQTACKIHHRLGNYHLDRLLDLNLVNCRRLDQADIHLRSLLFSTPFSYITGFILKYFLQYLLYNQLLVCVSSLHVSPSQFSALRCPQQFQFLFITATSYIHLFPISCLLHLHIVQVEGSKHGG